jgi:hypothetical protein
VHRASGTRGRALRRSVTGLAAVLVLATTGAAPSGGPVAAAAPATGSEGDLVAAVGADPASTGTSGSATTGGDAESAPSSGSDATSAAAGGRPAYLARQLRRDPVFVSPSVVRAAPPAAVDELRRRVRAMPYPTFVVVAPRLDEERGLDDFGDLPGLLRDRTGKDGLYLVSDEDGIGFDAEAFGVRPRGDVRRIGSIASDAVPRTDGLLARLSFALEHLRTGAPATRSVDEEEAAGDARFWWILGAATLVGAALTVGVASLTPGARARRIVRRRDRERRRSDAEREAAERASAASPAGDRGEARRQAQEASARLARGIAEAPDPPEVALRSYDAASHVLGRRGATALDFVGALTLAQAGEAALRGGPRRRPCFFDPRHGEATRDTVWRRDGIDARLPACEACSSAIDRDVAPASLLDGDRPYWEGDGVWARTGFGALDERVADVVLAGGRSAR